MSTTIIIRHTPNYTRSMCAAVSNGINIGMVTIGRRYGSLFAKGR